MANIHDLAREYLAKDGLNIRDTQKAGVFLFADWLLANGYAAQQSFAPDTASANDEDEVPYGLSFRETDF